MAGAKPNPHPNFTPLAALNRTWGRRAGVAFALSDLMEHSVRGLGCVP
jgi:hypothetical protein